MKKMHIYCDTDCPKLKKSILTEMSQNDCYFNALFEIVHNISKKKLKFKPNEKRKLKKYVKLMEKIIEKPKSKSKRVSAIKQSGGFFPIILPILGTVVAELIGNAIRKKSDSDS